MEVIFSFVASDEIFVKIYHHFSMYKEYALQI